MKIDNRIIAVAACPFALVLLVRALAFVAGAGWGVEGAVLSVILSTVGAYGLAMYLFIAEVDLGSTHIGRKE